MKNILKFFENFSQKVANNFKNNSIYIGSGAFNLGLEEGII